MTSKASPWLSGTAVPMPRVVVPECRAEVVAGPMWGISVEDLPEGVPERMLAELTCIPNEKHVMKTPWRKPVTFCLGHIAKGGGDLPGKKAMLWLPPWYALLALPNVSRMVTLTMGSPMNPKVVFTGTLREQPPQKQAAAAYLAWLPAHRATPSCILSLPCGYGKTVLCISIVAALKRRALILAHTNALVDQWLEELRRFLSADTRLGFVKENNSVVYQECDVIVASLASLLSHKRASAPYLQEMLPSIGTVVLDEGHHAVATTFWEILGIVPAALRLVLTATPRRRDGLTNQLAWVTGPIVFAVKRAAGTVHVVHLEFTGKGHVELPMSRRHVMVQRLCADRARTTLAVQLAGHLVRTQGRRVVIVTHLCEHVDELTAECAMWLEAAGVKPRVASVFHAIPFRKPRRKAGMSDAEDAALTLQALQAWEATSPHGAFRDVEVPLAAAVRRGLSTMDRDIAFEAHVVVATYPMLAEGVSYKQWDTLLFLGSTPDCEQVVGRILRECPTKQVPLVVDFYMDLAMFKGAHYSRARYYAQEGFTRENMQAASVADMDWSKWDKYNVNVVVASTKGTLRACWQAAEPKSGVGSSGAGADDDVSGVDADADVADADADYPDADDADDDADVADAEDDGEIL